jgi:hypothetical protein
MRTEIPELREILNAIPGRIRREPGRSARQAAATAKTRAPWPSGGKRRADPAAVIDICTSGHDPGRDHRLPDLNAVHATRRVRRSRIDAMLLKNMDIGKSW